MEEILDLDQGIIGTPEVGVDHLKPLSLQSLVGVAATHPWVAHHLVETTNLLEAANRLSLEIDMIPIRIP